MLAEHERSKPINRHPAIYSVKVTGIGLVIAAMCVLASAGPASAQRRSKATPCAVDLGSCPAQGCATIATDALSNTLKRTWPTSDTGALLTIDDFQALQDQADQLVGQNVPLSKADRAKLKNLSNSGNPVSEGDFVRVTGFIVGTPHPNKSGESVNCRLPGTENNDFHITLARNPSDTEFDGIVVEMIPQMRPDDWTIDKLKEIENNGQLVLVRGQLFYDNKHQVNADPDNALNGQPKRFALWEVHPISEFYVCTAAGNTCDPKDLAKWQLVAKVDAHAAPSAAPTRPATLTGPIGSSVCDAQSLQFLWQHVYKPHRLQIKQQCMSVTGTIAHVIQEKDGDLHIRLTLDPGQENLLNARNETGQHGDLVIEPICQGPVTQPSAMGFCDNFHFPLTVFPVGTHVRVTGSYVLDTEANHGWMEVHPVVGMEILP